MVYAPRMRCDLYDYSTNIRNLKTIDFFVFYCFLNDNVVFVQLTLFNIGYCNDLFPKKQFEFINKAVDFMTFYCY